MTTNRDKIEELSRTNSIVHAAMQAHRYCGHTYVEALEAAVLVLAGVNAEQQVQLLDMARKASPAPAVMPSRVWS